jgi:hypothetical protein
MWSTPNEWLNPHALRAAVSPAVPEQSSIAKAAEDAAGLKVKVDGCTSPLLLVCTSAGLGAVALTVLSDSQKR